MSENPVDIEGVSSLILRKRWQMLVHSCIYYRMGESIIDDQTFDKWAYQLVDLQKKYPDIAKKVRWAEAFQDFDGSTGFHLPISDPEIVHKAAYLLKLHKEKGSEWYEKPKG